MATIDFEPTELIESRESVQGLRRQSTGKRVWLCKWEDRFGSWVPTPNVTQYTDGIDSSDIGGFESKLYAKAVTRKGVGAGRIFGEITLPYDCCMVTVEYAERNTVGSETISTNGTGHVITITQSGETKNISLPLGIIEINKTILMGTGHLALWFSGIGKVNTNACRGFDAGTLRFEWPPVKQYYESSIGADVEEVKFRLAHNPYGWNNINVDGVWVPSPIQLYDTIDFGSLLI
jgi:hypothetical protein